MAHAAQRRFLFSLLTLLCAFALSACASAYRVDNQVESFPRWTDGSNTQVPAPPQTYRFERLPSQSTGSAAQSTDQLERWAQDALQPLGWTLAANAGTAPWTVEITGTGVRLPRAPWEDPWYQDRYGWFGQINVGIGSGGSGIFWSPWMMRTEMPYYQRRVAIVIRDSASGRVVYETSAAHDGRWNSTPELWRAMISAALEGFPSPPKGARQVNLDVPR
ncbi:MAG TPA: DUF4136 domain-containing protein [Hydrogenophaga sp.]